MIDALVLLYYAWIPSNEKKIYFDNVKEIYQKYHLSIDGKNQIKEMRKQMEKKN